MILPVVLKYSRRLAMLLLGLFALLAVWFVSNRITSGSRAVQVFDSGDGVPAYWGEGRNSFKVLAYNIAHLRGPKLGQQNGGSEVNTQRPQRLNDIARFLAESDADIVVLNEMDFDVYWSGHRNYAEIIANKAGYRYRVEQRNLDSSLPFFRLRIGNAILSRFPILEAKRVAYPAYAGWENWVAGKKEGVVATVELAEGRKVRVLAVHLSHRSEAVRVKSARRIQALAEASEIPLIAAGDFNSTLMGYPKASLDDEGNSAMSYLLGEGTFRSAQAERSNSVMFTFPSENPDRLIDWIIATPELLMETVHVLPVEHSDHLPVAAVFQFSSKF